MMNKKHLSIIVGLFILVLISAVAFASGGGSSQVDWQNKTIEATGVGLPPANANTAAQSKILARRAAIVDAYRSLTETTQGIQVDSDATIENLTVTNDTIKTNLQTYLDYYRILTDAVNIKDAFIINIGLEFEISVLSNYNSNETLLKCINELKIYFDIDRWQINQPIIKSEIVNLLGNVKGVQSVINVKFNNFILFNILFLL